MAALLRETTPCRQAPDARAVGVKAPGGGVPGTVNAPLAGIPRSGNCFWSWR